MPNTSGPRSRFARSFAKVPRERRRSANAVPRPEMHISSGIRRWCSTSMGGSSQGRVWALFTCQSQVLNIIPV